MAGLRQALLPACSPHLLDHPVGWPRWPILRKASCASKSTFTHNLGCLWQPVPDLAITVYPICPSRNITGLTSSWELIMFFFKGPWITCKQQVRFIGSLKCEFTCPASQDNTDNQHLVSQAVQSSSRSGDKLAHKGEDKAQMSRQANVYLFSVPAFTVSVPFPA